MATKIPTDCAICCEKFDKQTHAPIVCGNHECDTIACKTCVRTYLMGSSEQPHCMGCKQAWNQEFVVNNLNKSWYNKEYREHRKKLLVEVEMGKMPATMPAAMLYTQGEALGDEISADKEKLRLLRQEMIQLENGLTLKNRRRQLLLAGQDPDAKTQKKEVAKFVMACPSPECNGFLSSAYKCGICEEYACPQCMTMIGKERHNPEHTCDPDAVATAKLIKNTTRPCPRCGERVAHAGGCDQMWCVVPTCHTVFSWKTGKIQVGGVIHNPHFYQYQRRNGGLGARNVGDVPCGGLPHWFITRNILRQLFTRSHYNTGKGMTPEYSKELIEDFTRLHRSASHMINVTLPDLRTKIRDYTDFRQQRVLYLNKKMTKEELATFVFRRDNLRQKYMELVHIYELVSTFAIERFREICESLRPFDAWGGYPQPGVRRNIPRDFKYTVVDFHKRMVTLREEFHDFRKYCNVEFARVSATFNHTIVQLDEHFEQKRMKFSTKQFAAMLKEYESLTPAKRERKLSAAEPPAAAAAAAAVRPETGSPLQFEPAETFTGSRPGYVFFMGHQGLGYYPDDKSKAFQQHGWPDPRE